jgi:hypothetical protein
MSSPASCCCKWNPTSHAPAAADGSQGRMRAPDAGVRLLQLLTGTGEHAPMRGGVFWGVFWGV